MKKYIVLLYVALFAISSCTKEGSGVSSGGFASSSSNSGGDNTSGIITAGEWNDLDNWSFWLGLQTNNDFSHLADYWKMFLNNRISLIVKDGSQAIPNAIVELKKNSNTIWAARSDNMGKAELWIGFSQKENVEQIDGYQLFVNGSAVSVDLKMFENAAIEVQTNATSIDNSIELCFIVDATGSMGDEINFLKQDLNDVLQRVKTNTPNANLKTSCVFYRDKKDDYLVKKSNFSENINTTISFIEQQAADGGGDYPEAVHSGLNEAVNNLQWSQNGKTKIAFLILDAPPHHEGAVMDNIARNTALAAKKGIKLIPISASGVDKETEFLMRYIAMATNGTYVFITNDSGVGNDHIEASVGPYDVEFLNDLMVRLITKYAQ